MIKIEGVDPKMIANNLTPSEPIHPGEILKDEIEYAAYRKENSLRRWEFLPRYSMRY